MGGEKRGEEGEGGGGGEGRGGGGGGGGGTCVQRKTPVRFKSITSCHCDFFILINNVSRVIPIISFLFQLLEVKQMGVVAKQKIDLAVPALFTSTSMVPHVSTA